MSNKPIFRRFADLAGLESVETRQISPERLEAHLIWRAGQPIPANYATSVRLKTKTGETIAQVDTQPCYGFCPTSLWEPGIPIHDRRWLELPAGTPPGKDYHLEIVLYEATSLIPIDTPQINNVTLTEIPVKHGIIPQFVFPAGLAVAEFAVDRQSAEAGEWISVHIVWSLQKRLDRDLRARLLLLDEAGEQIVHAQPVPILADVPTSHWPLGAYIAQDYRVALPRGLLPGQYPIAIALDNSAGWFTPNVNLQVTPSTRVFDPPALSHMLNIDFGGQIRLLGYDLQQDDDALSLHVAWQTLTEIDRNYTTFVHLFDSTTEHIVAQWDAEPRRGAHPTSTWIAGEVVSDEFHIVTTDLPAGTYRLAMGLYDGTTGERLSAVRPDRGQLSDDRAVLEDEITIR
jgi:hypothetical protein